MQTADLTRDEAYSILEALVDHPYFAMTGPTPKSRALVDYIVTHDNANDWPFSAEFMAETGLSPIDFPCALAFVEGTCRHSHDWRPLTRDGLTFIPFGRSED